MPIDKVNGARIFITGGAGFVGSHLVEELLLLEPQKIYILDNLFRGSHENMGGFLNNGRVEFVLGDIRDQDLVDSLMSKSDYCFHLAALRLNACAANPAEAYDVMVKATFDIVEKARKYNIRKFIYSSSASVYGLAEHFPTPETDNPYDNKTFYGAAKLFGEQLLKSYHHMFGLNYIALRYFNIYGPRMDTDGKYTEVMIKWLECIKEARAPKIFGDGADTMDFIYVTDVARANVAALLSDVSDGVFNIGSGKETSLRELLEVLLRVNNCFLKPEHVQKNTVNPVRRRLADISKAASTLNFRPAVCLEEGLKSLSGWYTEKYGKKDD